MEIVALLGVDSRGNDVMEELRGLFKGTAGVTAVFHNDSAFWGERILEEFVIQSPEEIAGTPFDKLIVYGEPANVERSITELAGRYGLEQDRIVSCYDWVQFNVGPHQLDWNQVCGKSDIIRELQGCGTLNDLEEFYYNKPHRQMMKYSHYLEIYDRHFRKYRNRECVIVEVGVYKGGSLQMWKDYFGSKARIIGIDIDESVAAYAEDQISIEIGSQSDREFWHRFREKYPRVDIFIDDGGHTMEQQIVTFEEMFGHVAEDGAYLCEDLHTSYLGRYGGGYKNPNSYIENSKNLIDCINAWYNDQVYENECTRTIHSLHYYDSVLVIEKRKMHRGVCIAMGGEE